MIVCSECGENSFCIFDNEEFEGWVCRRCFMRVGYSYEEWEEACEEAREERQQRRNRQALSDYSNFSPVQRNKNRVCKYGCGKMLYWDDSIESKNKFVEVETKQLHTFLRCSNFKKQVIDNKKRDEGKL